MITCVHFKGVYREMRMAEGWRIVFAGPVFGIRSPVDMSSTKQ